VLPAVSATLIVKEAAAAAAVGLPDRTPVDGASFNQEGSEEPLATDQV
jgi:hypothetical protein